MLHSFNVAMRRACKMCAAESTRGDVAEERAHYWRMGQPSIRYTLGVSRRKSRCVCAVCAPSSRTSRISKDIVAALQGTRGSLTACVYRRLYLARAITSPSATDRTNERTSERTERPSRAESHGAVRRQRASISSQPVTLRPRSHGVLYPVPCYEISRTIAPAVLPRGRSLGPTAAAAAAAARDYHDASRRRDRSPSPAAVLLNFDMKNRDFPSFSPRKDRAARLRSRNRYREQASSFPRIRVKRNNRINLSLVLNGGSLIVLRKFEMS